MISPLLMPSRQSKTLPPLFEALAIHGFQPGGKFERRFAGEVPVVRIGKGSAEDDTQAFAIAFIEVGAALDEEVCGIFEEGIRHRHVVVRAERREQFLVVEDFKINIRKLSREYICDY